MEGVLAVTLIFGSPFVIVLVVFAFNLLRDNQRQRTIRMAMEKGLDIAPLLAGEEKGALQPQKYVLRGLLWGLPGFLIGIGGTWAAIRHDIQPYLSTLGWIPMAIGAAYLIFYRLGLAQNSGSGEASPSSTSALTRPAAR